MLRSIRNGTLGHARIVYPYCHRSHNTHPFLQDVEIGIQTLWNFKAEYISEYIPGLIL